MFSALAAVCTVDCAIEIVLITLHYITFTEIISEQIMKIGLHLPKYCENKSGLLLCEMGNMRMGFHGLYCTGVQVCTQNTAVLYRCVHTCTVQVCTQNTVYTTQASMACTVQVCTQNTAVLYRCVHTCTVQVYRCVHRTLSTLHRPAWPVLYSCVHRTLRMGFHGLYCTGVYTEHCPLHSPAVFLDLPNSLIC